MSSTACSEESYQSEAERLAKKLSEATEILDAREAKLVEMSRQNFELQEKNMDLIRLALLILAKIYQLKAMKFTGIHLVSVYKIPGSQKLS